MANYNSNNNNYNSNNYNSNYNNNFHSNSHIDNGGSGRVVNCISTVNYLRFINFALPFDLSDAGATCGLWHGIFDRVDSRLTEALQCEGKVVMYLWEKCERNVQTARVRVKRVNSALAIVSTCDSMYTMNDKHYSWIKVWKLEQKPLKCDKQIRIRFLVVFSCFLFIIR